jgi:AcrR family transcriptional regulator
MARPINADADATRKRILQSAVRLFAESGPSGASIRNIAKGADVSLAMVHHYFGTKDDLLNACIDSMYLRLGALREELEHALASGGDLSAIVDRAIRTCYRFAKGEQLAVRLLLRTVAENGELDAERRDAVQGPFLARVSELLGETLGRPANDLRLPLQSVVMLTARYAVSTERELQLFSAMTRGADAAVEDHLVEVASALLGVASHKGKSHAN